VVIYSENKFREQLAHKEVGKNEQDRQCAYNVT
jgi:hypothetical protein